MIESKYNPSQEEAPFAFHSKKKRAIKSLYGLEDKNGNQLIDNDSILISLVEYISELCADADRTAKPIVFTSELKMLSSEYTKLWKTKIGKVCGSDGFQVKCFYAGHRTKEVDHRTLQILARFLGYSRDVEDLNFRCPSQNQWCCEM